MTVTPQFVAAQESSTLRVTVPNERDSRDVTTFSLRVPGGMRVAATSRAQGWRTRTDGQTIAFSGGRVRPKQQASFTIEITGPRRAGAVTLDATLQYPDGSRVRWPVSLAVTPGSGPKQNLPAAAMVAVLGLVVLGSLLVLQHTRRTRASAVDHSSRPGGAQHRRRRRHGRQR